MSDELKVYPLMLHESAMKKLQEVAVAQNKKVEDIIEVIVSTLVVPQARASNSDPLKPQPPKRKEGWFKPGCSRKFHYFVEGRSLCRRYGIPRELDPDTGNKEATKEDCITCFRELVKRRARLGVEKIE